MRDLLTALSPLLVALVGIIGTIVVGRWGKKGEREDRLIERLQQQLDSQQEQQAATQQRLDTLEARVQTLESENLNLRTRDQWWSWHASRLEEQVSGAGLTPVPRPKELAEGVN